MAPADLAHHEQIHIDEASRSRDNIANQTSDDDMKQILRDTANEHREKAMHEPMFALFRGETQVAGSFATEQEVIKAALAEGLIPELQTTNEAGTLLLPAGYQIKQLEQPYDPQPSWKPPPEKS